LSPQTELEKIKEGLKEYLVGFAETLEKPPEFSDFKFESKKLEEYLKKLGIKLYKHQAEALKLLYSKNNVTLTTPTASGKSEVFRLYILDTLSKNPLKTFLLIFPTRALLYDQYENFQKRMSLAKEVLDLKIDPRTVIFLGDIPLKDRIKALRANPSIIFTTIDNLHLFLLKNHQEAPMFFKNLDLVVVDEVHSYRGVFGTNSAYVFRRLFRLLENVYKNTNYKILALSATLLNAKEFCEKLFNKKFEEVSNDSSIRYKKYIFLLDSKGVSSKAILKRTIRTLLENNIKSLVFLESKKGVELCKIYSQDLENSDKIHPYKASFTKDKRREIEQAFKKDKIKILITTSALELGIDIGDVKAVVNYGIPKDGLFSLIQRLGRAGRSSDGYNIIIFRKDALDFYYIKNKDKFLEALINNKIEKIPLNITNREVAKKHLLLLISELGKLDPQVLSDFEKEVLKELESEGKVKKIRDYFFGGNYYVLSTKDIAYSGLRSVSDKIYVLIKPDPRIIELVNRTSKKETASKILNYIKSIGGVLEEIDELAFYEYLLPGMIYYSSGKAYRISNYKTIGNVTFIIPEQVYDYASETSTISYEDVKILEEYSSKIFNDWEIYMGKIEVSKRFVGYVEIKKAYESTRVITHYYDEPIERKFVTNAIWIKIPKDYSEVQKIYRNILQKKLEKVIKDEAIEKEIIYNFIYSIDKEILYERYRGLTSRRIYELAREYLERFGISNKKLIFLVKKLIDCDYAFRSGLHAIEHNLIKISPAITNIDSRELGGYSYVFHHQLNSPVIFIYEGYKDGVGLSEILFENIEKLIEESNKILNSCKCLDGCPRCIFSTKCGNFNEFLDKYAARLIYKRLPTFKRST
jgi:DEAD/DEAH box helicase domain-containing protein